MNTTTAPQILSQQPAQVAVLGIGMMGFPIARRLCEAGCAVSVWNRSSTKAERLLPFGAWVADTPAGAVAQADIVITLLENGAVVEDVLFAQGAAQALRPGTLVRFAIGLEAAEDLRQDLLQALAVMERTAHAG